MVMKKFNMIVKGDIVKEVDSIIFKPEVKNTSNMKNIWPKLRIWAKIILSCIHHKPSNNSVEYINKN